MESDFTLNAYKKLLTTFLEKGYVVKGYKTVGSEKKHLILRHDIDMSPEAALPIAKIENELGLVANYFILIRSDIYNPFTRNNHKYIKQLIELGHNVGLHFDASLYQANREELDEATEIECDILQHITQQSVEMISFHRPVKELLNNDCKVAGRRHTYQPRYFSEIGYCSDSRGKWNYGHPLNHDAYFNGTALQLLTHPIWWNAESHMKSADKLDVFLEQKLIEFDVQISEQCEIHIPGRIIK